MEEFTNFENFDILSDIFSDENDQPVLPAEDTEPDTTRFPNLTENDIEEIKNSNVKVNTERSTKTWMNVWLNWCSARGISQPIESFPYEQLDKLLSKFYGEVKKVNVADYEPESLRVMQAAIDRYLRDKDYGESIISSRQFHQSMKTLNAKAARLRQQGMGKRPNKAEALNQSEEELLWQNGSLGNHSPVALTNANFKCLSEQMGLRGRQDHYDAHVEDFILRKHDDGSESIVFNENPTKTRSGGLRVAKRTTKQVMWSTDGGPRDPVKLFKLWLSKRPQPMRNQGPLYLTIIQRPKNDDVWYTKVRMGQNTIGKIMPRMTSSLESSTAKKLTNHSTRKTVVQKLKSAGQPRYKIKEITGHASEASLNDYDVISEEERRELSHIISGYSASASRTTTSVPSIASSSTAPRPTEHNTSIVPVQVRQQIASASNAILRQEGLLSIPSSVDHDVPLVSAKNPVSSSLAPVNIAYNNCVFNIGNQTVNMDNSAARKRRRAVIFDSDSD